MPKTQLRPDQVRAVDPADVAAAEKKFWCFFSIAAVVFVGVAISMSIPDLNWFWAGHRIWSIGSLLVCVSVLHSRFFDIKKNSSPHNVRLDADSLARSTARLEDVCKHAWLLGFAFVGVAQWVHH